MAITSFIPTIWHAELLQNLQKELVSGAFFNHNYEGEIMHAGSVKINKLADVQLRDYAGTVTYDSANTADVTLTIDTKKYFAVKVDDVDKAQAKGELRAPITQNGASQLAAARDKANFKELVTGAGVKLDNSGSGYTVQTAEDAKALLRAMKLAADKANVPQSGRVFVAEWDFANLLLGDTALVVNPQFSQAIINNGYVGRLYGIDLYASNNMYKGAGDDECYAVLSHRAFATEADQIQELEALRPESSFSDAIRGLDVSGRKVVMKEGVICAQIASY